MVWREKVSPFPVYKVNVHNVLHDHIPAEKFLVETLLVLRMDS